MIAGSGIAGGDGAMVAPRFDFRNVEESSFRPSTLCTDKERLSRDGPMQGVIPITGPFERRSLYPTTIPRKDGDHHASQWMVRGTATDAHPRKRFDRATIADRENGNKSFWQRSDRDGVPQRNRYRSWRDAPRCCNPQRSGFSTGRTTDFTAPWTRGNEATRLAALAAPRYRLGDDHSTRRELLVRSEASCGQRRSRPT